jgi:hypothetical protein
MEDAVRYPVDYDAVRKGDVIGTEQVEAIHGHRSLGLQPAVVPGAQAWITQEPPPASPRRRVAVRPRHRQGP